MSMFDWEVIIDIRNGEVESFSVLDKDWIGSDTKTVVDLWRQIQIFVNLKYSMSIPKNEIVSIRRIFPRQT